MTEPQQPNPLAEFFDSAPGIGTIVVDEHDDGTIFNDAVVEQFNQTMTWLSEQVPEDDEDAANAMMADAVQGLMITSFKAGMLFQHTQQQDSAMIDVGIDPEDASAILTGLLGDGATLRLVVERGQD